MGHQCAGVRFRPPLSHGLPLTSRVLQLFNELPPKRDYPDYYLIITQPIVRHVFRSDEPSLTTRSHPQSLKEIKKKVNNGTYPDTDAFARDIHLMLNNAMTYVRIRVC